VRSIKGYAMRQARREVYKAFDPFIKGNTYANKNVKEDKFEGKTVWEYIKWVFEPEKM
jgi:hypothetical protein